MTHKKPAELLVWFGSLGDRRQRTVGDYAVRMLLLALLFASIISAAILNGYFTAAIEGNRCLDFNAHAIGGRWDCVTQQRVGGWREVGAGLDAR